MHILLSFEFSKEDFLFSTAIRLLRMGIKNGPVDSVNSPDSTIARTVPSFLDDASAEDLRMQPRWNRIRYALRDPFSEFFGTMILILFGDGVVAQVTLSQSQKGDYQSISWGWG
jgi:aquaglyceroporin related protein